MALFREQQNGVFPVFFTVYKTKKPYVLRVFLLPVLIFPLLQQSRGFSSFLFSSTKKFLIFPVLIFLELVVLLNKKTKTLLKDMEIKQENSGLTGKTPQGKWKKGRESKEDEVLNH